MKIGYASLTYGVPETHLRTCTAKYATEEKLKEIITHNLHVLGNIVAYNRENGIRFFRISSSLIPFASSPVNQLAWWEIFAEELENLKFQIKEAGIRITMHPGQYTVLNSPDQDVVDRAIEDLVYHDRLLSSLGAGGEGKIILHVGGVYGDKESALKRFASSYEKLPQSIKNRLIIENDDVSYTIEDVLKLSRMTGAPVVYDNLHNRLNPSDPIQTDAYWIEKASETWNLKDGKQKMHYSQQAQDRRAGGHSQTLHLEEFERFYHTLPHDLDIMLEVKDKNLSALKVLHLIEPERGIKGLEKEWSRYKYAILEHSPAHYEKIRTLLKDKSAYPVMEFYHLIDEALAQKKEPGKSRNAFDHVWGYFKNKATEKEKKRYEGYLKRFENGTLSEKAVKNLLYTFAETYKEKYLLYSYFFFM